MISLSLSKGGRLHMVQNDELPMKIGKNLKTLLKNKGYTYETFAERYPADVRTVGRWVQKGIDRISIICRIAEILDMKVEDVINYGE